MSEQDKDVIEERMYVRMPTEDDEVQIRVGDPLPQPKLAIGEAEAMDMAPSFLTGLTATSSAWHWKDDKLPPVEAIRNIITSVKVGIYPSVGVLEWLAEGLQDYWNRQGEKSMEQCLGLKRKAGHTANLMKESNRKHVNAHLMDAFSRLRYGLGLKVGESAEILAAWMETPNWYTGPYDFKPLSETTLLEHWKNAKWARSDDWKGLMKKTYAEKDRRQQYIEQYPRHCWQHIEKLKEYL